MKNMDLVAVSCVIVSSFLVLMGCSQLNEVVNCEEDKAEGEIGWTDSVIADKTEDVKADFDERVKIVIEVRPKSINFNEIPRFIEITVKNLGEVEYRGSYHYAIEYYDGSTWLTKVSPAVYDIEVAINPGESLVMPYGQLMPDDHNYTVGNYRVKYDKWYGEFSITMN